MKREEAIRLLGVIDTICTMQMGDYGEREHNAMLMAIADMEKQIPKKPNEEQKDCVEATIPRCPNCYSMFVEKYCAKCGQALDWSEEND